MTLTLTTLPIAGAWLVKSQPRADERGALARLFCTSELADVFGDRHIMQANQSLTRRVGAVRGLHFQRPPRAEMKLVRCLRGRVWDVLVDLRRGSPTFLTWHAVELEPTSRAMIVIPEGCAHGFQVLEPESELLYLHSAPYDPALEGGLRCDDPRLAISWPLPPIDLSARDAAHPLLKPDYAGFDT